MRVVLLAAGFTLLLGGCGDQVQSAAKEAVSSQMRDPSSTKFRNVSVVKQIDDSEAVCGEVNAKNGFGAYVGFAPFVYADREVFVGGRSLTDASEIRAETEYTKAHTRYCLLAGKPLDEVEAQTERLRQRLREMDR